MAADDRREFSLREPMDRESPIRFDLFELDARASQLRRGGIPVDLPPQALRLLKLLADRPNELVGRDAIKHALWPDESYGDFDSRLNFAVKKLREGLSDDAGRPRYIQTERKAGYRFIAPVQPLDDLPAHPPLALVAQGAPVTSAAPTGFRIGGRLLLTAIVVLASFVLIAIGDFVLRARRVGADVTYYIEKAVASADDSKPEISSVSPIFPQARQKIVVRGRGLGLHVPYARTDTPYLAIRDNTAHWAAGRMVPHNWDEVMLDVESWRDDEIVIGGFSGEYGKNGWMLSEGDAIEVAIWNPQNGAGPALYHTSVVSVKPEK